MKDMFQEINLEPVFGYIKNRGINYKANDIIHDLKDQSSDLCGDRYRRYFERSISKT